MNQLEVTRLQAYMRTKFGTDRLKLKFRKETDDSVEVLLGDEFIGLIYKDEDEGEISYDFNMAILDVDVASVAV